MLRKKHPLVKKKQISLPPAWIPWQGNNEIFCEIHTAESKNYAIRTRLLTPPGRQWLTRVEIHKVWTGKKETLSKFMQCLGMIEASEENVISFDKTDKDSFILNCRETGAKFRYIKRSFTSQVLYKHHSSSAKGIFRHNP